MKSNKLIKLSKLLIIPMLATIIISGLVAFIMYQLSNDTFEEIYIENNIGYSKNQVEKIIDNKKTEKTIIDSLNNKLMGSLKVILEHTNDGENITNEYLKEINDIFELNEIWWYNNEGTIINSSDYDNEETYGYIGWNINDEGNKGDKVYQFFVGGLIEYYEGIRESDITDESFLFVYLRAKNGYFIQASVTAEEVEHLIEETNPINLVHQITDSNPQVLMTTIINKDLNIVATSNLFKINSVTDDIDLYLKVFDGDIVNRSRFSPSLNKRVLEVIVPIEIDGEIDMIISTLYSLDFYKTMNNQFTITLILLTLSIIGLSYTLMLVHVIRPLTDLENSISTFDPVTAKYDKPKKQNVVFVDAFNALESLSVHVDKKNYETEALHRDIYIQSVTDYLTKLPNRRNLISYLKEKIELEEKFSVLFLDLDNFKAINDSKGHVIGDEVLIELSKRLTTICEGKSYISRYGGDEFIIVLDTIDNKNIETFIERVYDSFSNPIITENEVTTINFSIGISKYPLHGNVDSELIRKSDIAVYEAKNRGRNQYIYYDESMDVNLQKEQNIKELLEDAIKNEDFKLLLQPQVDIYTKEIVSFEALLRLTKHNISPYIFIQIAEKYDLINDIGRIVIKLAIDAIKILRNNNIEKTVYINYSAKQLKDLNNLNYIISIMDENNIPYNLLGIEITETLIIEEDYESSLFFETLKEKDFKLAIDDFGSGNASINYLINYPVDTVKLDRSFALSYLTEEKLDIYSTVIDLATKLGFVVLAEGLEEKWQIDLLKQTRCHLVQGYYFYKPLSIEDVIKIYKD